MADNEMVASVLQGLDLEAIMAEIARRAQAAQVSPEKLVKDHSAEAKLAAEKARLAGLQSKRDELRDRIMAAIAPLGITGSDLVACGAINISLMHDESDVQPVKVVVVAAAVKASKAKTPGDGTPRVVGAKKDLKGWYTALSDADKAIVDSKQSELQANGQEESLARTHARQYFSKGQDIPETWTAGTEAHITIREEKAS
jgi:hypothetical protein